MTEKNTVIRKKWAKGAILCVCVQTTEKETAFYCMWLFERISKRILNMVSIESKEKKSAQMPTHAPSKMWAVIEAQCRIDGGTELEQKELLLRFIPFLHSNHTRTLCTTHSTHSIHTDNTF